MRSPSSLIFLVLLGVWAAYFVQYWIRRRDHLATARSVEQFSAAMRVLERRAPIPRTDLSDPAPRSWSLHPARSTRPQVVVKRAVPAEPASPRPVSEPTAARRAPGSRPARRPGAPRRVRGLLLLTSLVATLVTGVLAGLGVLLAWAPAVAAGALVLSFTSVRAGVRADRAARTARRRRAEAEARRRAQATPAAAVRRTPRPAPSAEPAPAARESAGAAAEVTVAAEATAQAPDETVAASVPAEPMAPVAQATPEAEPETVIEYVHLVDEDDIPLTWEPVPVPRPTYTMKAKAERPAVAPAAVTADPAPVETPLRPREDDLDQRRVAGA